MEDRKLNAIAQAASYLIEDNPIGAKQIIDEVYPFTPIRKEKRKYSVKQMVMLFFRDGFIDRYSGERLLNPGILRILSERLPNEFPYHPHGKMDQCHIAYWIYQPTVDHIYPVSLGGKDSLENWVTTSMVCNSAKGNFTLEQLGWTLKEKGDLSKWDGLSNIFIQLVEQDQKLLEIDRIRVWYNATKEVMLELGLL